MSDCIYFDALTRINPRTFKHPLECWSLDHLLEQMRHCSISAALVYSAQSVIYDPNLSNQRLCAQLKPHRQLHACWNVMPPSRGEFPEPDKLIEAMRQQGVQAVILHPKTNGWSPRSVISRELLGTLEQNRILTLLDAAELADFVELEAMLERYPRLPLLLTGAFWSQQRQLLPLLDVFANLHLTFEKLQIHHGLEELAGSGFEDRMLFGSNGPQMSAGAHRSYLDYASLSDAVKAKIAGGNLSRLLGVPLPAPMSNPDEDELMAAARQGQKPSIATIDFHMHVVEEGLYGVGDSHRQYRGGPTGIREGLDRIGCVAGGFMSWNGPVSNDVVLGNRVVSETLDTLGPSFWGLATLDVTHYSREEMIRMMHEVYADKRFIGMKPYPRFGLPYHDPAYDPWWAYGNEQGFYGLLHLTRGDFAEVESLAPRFPNVRWVVAHCGMTFAWADKAIACMNKHPNVFAEITYTTVPNGVIEHLVRSAGEDRVIYGSDLPMRDPRQQFGWVVYAKLPVAVKKKILRENALKVLEPLRHRWSLNI